MNEASALLFAHDSEAAEDSILDTLEHDQNRRKAKLLKKKHNEFVGYVIKDWIEEMQMEQ